MGLVPNDTADWFARGATPEEQLLKRKTHASEHAFDVVDPAAAQLAADAIHTFFNQPTGASLIEAALCVPDDLCVMRKSGTDFRLVAASLCAPSYWSLAQKMGCTLQEIHAPVVGLDQQIGARMRSFFDNLPMDRVFARRNWFLHNDAHRFHPQDDERVAAIPERLVIRSERQTLRRLDASVILFSIDVTFAPLAEITQYPQAARAMLQAIDGWSPQERASFGEFRLNDALMEFLRSAAVEV